MQATNLQEQKAQRIFQEAEGIDIHPAAAVALATLIKEIQSGNIDRKATIMLNVTGGGEARYKADKEISYLKPSLVFPLSPDADEVVAKCEELFK